ncbi:hypothetical protein IKF92_03870 [Candidatus Saccharibacteria bacterium]|nr:hypothetical protein [Candidatus Saccharibacteria bacterium]
MKNEKEYNKELFIVEAVIGVAATILMLFVVFAAALLMNIQTTVSVALIVVSIVSYIIICLGLTKMEQIVGYYECTKCHNKQKPSYSSVLWSMHFGRTRYLNCSKCHKKTWQKKVI